MLSLKLSDLPEGIEIYYHGDMANDSGFGVVSGHNVDKFGHFVKVTMNDGRRFTLPVSNFSSEYAGNGLTRFVTRAAYNDYQKACQLNFAKTFARSQNKKFVAALCDHPKMKVIEKQYFYTKAEAVKWARDQVEGYCQCSDAIVSEERDQNGVQWVEYIVETETGILDFYVEIHPIN